MSVLGAAFTIDCRPDFVLKSGAAITALSYRWLRLSVECGQVLKRRKRMFSSISHKLSMIVA